MLSCILLNQITHSFILKNDAREEKQENVAVISLELLLDHNLKTYCETKVPRAVSRFGQWQERLVPRARWKPQHKRETLLAPC